LEIRSQFATSYGDLEARLKASVMFAASFPIQFSVGIATNGSKRHAWAESRKSFGFLRAANFPSAVWKR